MCTMANNPRLRRICFHGSELKIPSRPRDYTCRLLAFLKENPSRWRILVFTRQYKSFVENRSVCGSRVNPTLRPASSPIYNQAIAEGRRWGTIYADPPWLYSNQGT